MKQGKTEPLHRIPRGLGAYRGKDAAAEGAAAPQPPAHWRGGRFDTPDRYLARNKSVPSVKGGADLAERAGTESQNWAAYPRDAP